MDALFSEREKQKEDKISIRRPDFYLVGAAKAGTTTVYTMLSKHGEVFMPSVKEPEFFARDDLFLDGYQSYQDLFSEAKSDQKIGEASTIYSLSPLFPNAAERIADYTPNAKIIYIVRDPVDRAYSYYLQICKNYQSATRDSCIHRSFEEFLFPGEGVEIAPRDKCFAEFDSHLPDEPELFLAGSDYVVQIEEYLKFFPREQILVLKFEDLLENTELFMNRVAEFIGVAPFESHHFLEENTRQNISSDFFRRKSDIANIEEMRDRLGFLWVLRKFLPSSFRRLLRSQALRFLSGRREVSMPRPMLPSTRGFLVHRFAKDLDRLESLTGIRYDLN